MALHCNHSRSGNHNHSGVGMNTLLYARAYAATTLLANALAKLWTKKSRTHEGCLELSAILRYTHLKIREWLEEVGCELTDAEIEDECWKLVYKSRTLEEKVEAAKDADSGGFDPG